MAEVLATMVVGPLVSMVKDKASSYLLDQYKVMEGMEEQHKLLKRKLPAVLDVITDAEEQAAKNREGAKAWLAELRNVAYKANDVLDEFKYEALRRKAKAEGHYKEFGMDVIKLFPSHNRFVFRYRMANKLHIILQELDVLIAEMNTFRFKFKPQPPMSLKWRQTDPNIPDHSVDIANESRVEEKKEIVDALLGQGDNVGLTILPIVGMGGMGKTTLAQLIYNDSAIQKHFQVQIWVCVSENFDVDSLFETIVKEAEKNGCQMTGSSTMEKFKSAVSGKRYLLVLDDVWNREAYKWEKLRSYLHHGGTGSSVVTTTRDENIAQFMGTIKAHKIKGLDLSSIKKIIETRAFSSQAQRPDELLKRTIGDVAKRCSGSPLAATALGSILLTKNTVQEWEAVLNRSTICDEENGILPILKLSYNCLPPHMRQCFAFCAMFPKDHVIDAEMLIQLWMANSFIPEQQGVCPEVTGKQIFNELAQRSFFQEVEQVRSDVLTYLGHGYCARTTCKIHDLMHDVAQDSMGKECATLDTEVSQSEDFLYSAHHLFLSVDIPENVMNASQEKGSLAIQTLICDKSIQHVQHLSKHCRSVRALKTRQGSFLEPKYLHHLRYLDLSRSDIEALPEDITILYHLQTLNLSYCEKLEQLPKAMKYMSALRHLYTHGCDMLKSMPPNLGHLTSLQILTWFVLGTGPGCSNMGELKNLDLGGQLELRWLENATAADAKAANLWGKKRLEELTLRWSHGHDKEADKDVLEGLRPHDGLKAMRMYWCGSSGIPTWMLELQGMVELELKDCQNLEKLPALWKLPSLRFLYLSGLQNLHCLFSGGAPSKFQKLKRMNLWYMPKFETWWDTNEVQGEGPLFPEVECLQIDHCDSLTALPKASVVEQSSSKDDTWCHSAFPALREMVLDNLEKFQRWEAVDGTLGEQVTFPQLEKLKIWRCSELTTFPEAPKLSTLDLGGWNEEASLQAASKYISSLSSLRLDPSHNSDYNKEENSIEVVVRDHESPSPLGDLVLKGCDLVFSLSSASKLWKCFGQLSQLQIWRCNGLVYWPQNLFQGLVSLRTLKIWSCDKLTGNTKEEEASDEQPAPEQSGSLPRLESLVIGWCGSLVQVPNTSASLKTLHIEMCESLKSIAFSGAGVVQRLGTSSSWIAAGSSSNEDESTVSTAVILNKLSSSSACSNHCFFPRLEFLKIVNCGGLTEVASLPLSTKTLKICVCSSLVSVSGEVTSLEELIIEYCERLESLPSGPHQVYSSLRVLTINECPGIKQFLPSLHQQQRLNHLDEKDLDQHLQEQVELDSRTLEITRCDKLTGHTKEEASDDEQSAPEQSGSLPRMTCLVQVPNTSASPKSIAFSGAGVVQRLETSSSLIAAGSSSNEDESTVSTAVLKLSSSSASSNHGLFPRLESLTIFACCGLTEVASLPLSIKTLKIWACSSLVSVSGEVTSLEELIIEHCERLESLPSGPHQVYSSLRVLTIIGCHGIKQLLPSLHQQRRLNHLDEKDLDQHLQEQVELDSKAESMSDATSTSVVLKQSSPAGSNHCFFPSLESLQINDCRGLTEFDNLPPSIKTFKIFNCGNLVSLSGEVPMLEELKIRSCGSLKSLPNGHHQSYSSLRVLSIDGCGCIKQLPPSLQQRLDHLEEKALDRHLQVRTGRIAAITSKLESFRSRSED